MLFTQRAAKLPRKETMILNLEHFIITLRASRNLGVLCVKIPGYRVQAALINKFEIIFQHFYIYIAAAFTRIAVNVDGRMLYVFYFY